MSFRALALAVVAVAVFAGEAQAARRIYSFLPADAATRARIDSGLTFVLDQGMFGARVEEILATEAKARAGLEPVSEKPLGLRLDAVLPKGSFERDLYAVKDEDQGTAMIRAFCPGSTHGWLVFGPVRARRNLVVQALGNDPATGKARHCATLSFTFRGEWAIPLRGVNARATATSPDPIRLPF